jgi:hypothetical protein
MDAHEMKRIATLARLEEEEKKEKMESEKNAEWERWMNQVDSLAKAILPGLIEETRATIKELAIHGKMRHEVKCTVVEWHGFISQKQVSHLGIMERDQMAKMRACEMMIEQLIEKDGYGCTENHNRTDFPGGQYRKYCWIITWHSD